MNTVVPAEMLLGELGVGYLSWIEWNNLDIAGVIFAIQPDSDAMFAMALMGGMAMLTPLDFKEKRWFQPLANFGQFVVAGAVAGFLLDVNLGRLQDPGTDNLLREVTTTKCWQHKLLAPPIHGDGEGVLEIAGMPADVAA